VVVVVVVVDVDPRGGDVAEVTGGAVPAGVVATGAPGRPRRSNGPPPPRVGVGVAAAVRRDRFAACRGLGSEPDPTAARSGRVASSRGMPLTAVAPLPATIRIAPIGTASMRRSPSLLLIVALLVPGREVRARKDGRWSHPSAHGFPTRPCRNPSLHPATAATV